MKPDTATKCLHYSLALILAFALSACATAPSKDDRRQSETTHLQQAQQAIDRGDLGAAAREYLRLADIASPPRRQEYRLQAAEILLRGNYITQAQRVLHLTPPQALPAGQLIRRQLLSARIALARNRMDVALQALNVPVSAETPAETAAELYRLRAEAYSRAGRLVEAARNQMLRSHYLSDPDDVSGARRDIWKLLSLLPEITLSQSPRAAAPDEFSGWLELAQIAKMAQSGAAGIGTLITSWHEHYPQHPAVDDIMNALLARQQRELRYPEKIALLLPLSGTYGKAAGSIRDGFLAAHYQRGMRPDTPAVLIYDVNNFTSPAAAYQQAVTDGAKLVVGPLRKDSVNTLAASELPVPVLTLNYAREDLPLPENLYQFGLSPEDEARQVAERAWLDGHNQALAFVPEGEWGERLLTAFSEHWQALGGTLLESGSYPPQDSDFSKQLRRLLDIDLSNQRFKSLTSLLGRGRDIEFEPRRRQDADFIFVAAFPRQARLIRPQLKFHFASTLPVYATSHVYSGKKNRRGDRDMDGIIFCDIPWLLDDGNMRLKQRIEKLWPDEAAQYSRFYALGVDAYNLIPHLEYMTSYQYEHFSGTTGILHFIGNRRIFRQLQWARFKSGLPRPW